ncbi:hypothetical protein [Methylobacterium nodulans]|uniref:Uncharacterized protein n=1 Tax=Methylobacterium nodulans (strain LMG 21967 / CNCM I-2342 / ORS 2060) TaxID=460265 RepID=B8IGU8_METNO|nr:hypothetical protein [Methylobacterium nodulans]ACL57823.1 conserved hypothetical protein [Methylobacterium nodulans ORS 2060]
MSEFDGQRRREPGSVAGAGASPLGYLPLLPTLCVTACLAAGSLYWRETPPRSAAGQVAAVTPLPSNDLFQAVPEEGDRRVRAPFPLEFEQQFPLIAATAAQASREAGPVAGPICDAVPILPVRDRMQAAEGRSAAKRPAAAHRPTHLPLLAGVRPPPRPESLRPETLRVAAERQPETPLPDRPRFTDLALPHVVETGREMVATVTHLGDGVVQAGSAMLDLIDRRP